MGARRSSAGPRLSIDYGSGKPKDPRLVLLVEGLDAAIMINGFSMQVEYSYQSHFVLGGNLVGSTSLAYIDTLFEFASYGAYLGKKSEAMNFLTGRLSFPDRATDPRFVYSNLAPGRRLMYIADTAAAATVSSTEPGIISASELSSMPFGYIQRLSLRFPGIQIDGSIDNDPVESADYGP